MVENLWRMSIYGTVLILVVLAVRLFLQKYPKVYSYSLWITVLIRLLCPVFLTGSYSFQPDLKNIPYMYVYEQTDDGQRILPYEKGTASDTRRQAGAAWQTEYPAEAHKGRDFEPDAAYKGGILIRRLHYSGCLSGSASSVKKAHFGSGFG